MITFVVPMGGVGSNADSSSSYGNGGSNSHNRTSTSQRTTDLDEEYANPCNQTPPWEYHHQQHHHHHPSWYNIDNSSRNASLFCGGTGFYIFPSLSILPTVLNVTQLPTIIVVDNQTGKTLPSDAILAIERNDSDTVITAWQQGKSGLSCIQKIITVSTCESHCCYGSCSIM
jgi:hypothetical protein